MRQGRTSRRQCWKYNITTFLMAEDLNGYFSSERILVHYQFSFQEVKFNYLIVTPEMVAKKIKAMKDNKSPGVDGIPPKLLMETVDYYTI